MIYQVSFAPGGQIIDVFNYIKKIEAFFILFSTVVQILKKNTKKHTRGMTGKKGKSGMKGEK